MGDTIQTKIHTCPFDLARSGEVAVYSLQFLYKTNWRDLSPVYADNQNSESVGFSASDQAQLWKIIMKKNELAKMKDHWRKKTGTQPLPRKNEDD